MANALSNLLGFFKVPLRLVSNTSQRLRRARLLKKDCENTGWDVEAEQVADRLLRDVLGDRYSEFQRLGYLDVRSRLFPDVVYRLRMARPIEVRGVDRFPRQCRICVVVGERVPPSDELLAKLLWLQTDEARLLAVANRVE